MRRVGNVRWIGGTLHSISGSWSEDTMTNRASPRRGFFETFEAVATSESEPHPRPILRRRWSGAAQNLLG